MAALKTNGGYEQIKNLLSSTVILLCKNGVPFSHKLHVEALVGVTVDTNDVFFVHISETIPHGEQPVSRDSSPARHGNGDHYRQSESRSSRGLMRKEPYQRPGPLSSKSLPRNLSPLSAVPRSGSPSIGRQQHRNGLMQHHHQQRRQHHTDFMVADMPRPLQKVTQMPSPLQKVSGLPSPMQEVGGMPSHGQKRPASDNDDVVVIREEHLQMPESVAKPATMVASQRRAPRPSSASEVTVIEPDPSVDDTQAMQQGYLNTTKPNLKDTLVEDTGAAVPPPPKRPCTNMDSNNSSNSSFMSDRSPTDTTTSSSAGPYFAGQWSVGEPSLPPHPVTYSDPISRTIQAFPSCSSWAAPANPELSTSKDAALQPPMAMMTRGFKNPRNNTMCQPVRDVLEFSLAQPVLAQAHEVSAFRLFWRGHDTIAGWQNIIYNRLELDAIVAEHAGVSFFISAITATARDPKTIVPTPTDARLRAYPALGYWIVSRDGTFDRHSLMKKLSNAAEGGELKTMLQNDGEKANETGALNLIVKDYGKGYVQQRVSESAQICCGPGEEHPTIRFILKEEFFEEKLREAVDLLSGVGCPVSLEKVDMEALNPDEEDVGGNAARQEKKKQGGTGSDDFVIHVVKDEQGDSDSARAESPEVIEASTEASTEHPQIEIVCTRSLSAESPLTETLIVDNSPEESSSIETPSTKPIEETNTPPTTDITDTPPTTDMVKETPLMETLSMAAAFTNSPSVDTGGIESPSTETLTTDTHVSEPQSAVEPSTDFLPAELPTETRSAESHSPELPPTELSPSEPLPIEPPSTENLSECEPLA